MAQPNENQGKGKGKPKHRRPKQQRFRGHPVQDEGDVTGQHPAVPVETGGGGGGGQGGGGGGEAPPNEFNIPNLPPEIANAIHRIFVKWGSNQDQAIHEAMTYLMGTQWFDQEYAGYKQGYAKGLFSDPFSGGLVDYRNYKTSLQSSYRQYWGREATINDITNAINSGWTANDVQQHGQGYVNVQSNQGNWQYLSGSFGGGQLTEEEKKAYGEELAGIDTPLGQQIKNKVDAALQRFQGVFQGQLGSSALGDQQLSQRISKPKDIQA